MGSLPLVILSAGKGRRLEPVTNVIPKALLRFGNRTLTELLIHAFASAGVTNVVLCVGHKADEIARVIGSNCYGLPVSYVFNPLFYKTGAGYSLKLASGLWLHRDCIIVEGDQLIHPDIAKKIVNAPPNSMLVDSTAKPEYTEETVIVGQRGEVERIIWPASNTPENLRSKVVGEAVVMAKICNAANPGTSELAFALGDGEIIGPLEQIVQSYVDVAGLPWIEIDTLGDMVAAEKLYYSKLEDLYSEKL